MGGRRTGREREGGEDGERGQEGGEGDGHEEKTRTYPWLELCASESTCSLSKGQSRSCLPETGGEGEGGAQPCGRWGAGNLNTVEGGSVCTRVGGSGGGWCCPGVGPGAEPTAPRHDGAHRGDTGRPQGGWQESRLSAGDREKEALVSHAPAPASRAPASSTHTALALAVTRGPAARGPEPQSAWSRTPGPAGSRKSCAQLS